MEALSDSELDTTIFNMDVTKELILTVYSKHIPDKIKPNKNNKLRKLPFESTMYDQYEAGAHCVNFRITKPRIIAWIWAVINYHEEMTRDEPDILMDVKHFNEKGIEVDTKNGDENVVKVQLQIHKWTIDDPEHLVTIHLHITQGTCMMQGKMYSQWAEKDFPKILEKANEFTSYQKERRNYKQVSQSTPKHSKRRSRRIMEKELNASQKPDEDETEVKSVETAETQVESEKSANDQIQDTCLHLDTNIGELVSKVISIQSESRDQENRLNVKLKMIQDMIKANKEEMTGISKKLDKIETRQNNILQEIKDNRQNKKNKNKDASEEEKVTNNIQKSIEKIDAHLATVCNKMKELELNSDKNEGMDNKDEHGKEPKTVENSKKDTHGKQNTADFEGIKISTDKTKLVISDSQLSSIDNADIGPNTEIRSCGNADLQDWIDILEKTKTHIHIEHVLFHCGINERNGVQKNTKSRVIAVINIIEEKFPRAKITISGVLPTRDNKNVIQIGEINDLYEDICTENHLSFANFSDTVKDENGCIRRGLYKSPVHFTSEGQKILATNIGYALSEHKEHSGEKEHKKEQKPPKDTDGLDQSKSTENSSDIPEDPKVHKIGASECVEDRGNKFVAYTKVVNSRSEFLQFKSEVLAKSEQNMKASHIMSAYRIRSKDGLEQRYDDDGERGAGYKLMNSLRIHGLVNVAVIVLRWFTVHIGQARWQHMMQCALDAMLDANIIKPEQITDREKDSYQTTDKQNRNSDRYPNSRDSYGTAENRSNKRNSDRYQNSRDLYSSTVPFHHDRREYVQQKPYYRMNWNRGRTYHKYSTDDDQSYYRYSNQYQNNDSNSQYNDVKGTAAYYDYQRPSQNNYSQFDRPRHYLYDSYVNNSDIYTGYNTNY